MVFLMTSFWSIFSWLVYLGGFYDTSQRSWPTEHSGWVCGVISDIFSVTQGVPQGGVLSPRLFNLVLEALPHYFPGTLGRTSVHIEIYANNINFKSAARKKTKISSSYSDPGWFKLDFALSWRARNSSIFWEDSYACVFTTPTCFVNSTKTVTAWKANCTREGLQIPWHSNWWPRVLATQCAT